MPVVTIQTVEEWVTAFKKELVAGLAAVIYLNSQNHFMSDQWLTYITVALAFFSGNTPKPPTVTK